MLSLAIRVMLLGISGKQVTEILNYEVEVIKTVINTSYPNIKTVFYTSEYKHVLPDIQLLDYVYQRQNDNYI